MSKNSNKEIYKIMRDIVRCREEFGSLKLILSDETKPFLVGFCRL